MSTPLPPLWCRLLILLACGQPCGPVGGTPAEEPPPAGRLEFATGVRDDVVPEAITAERFRWRPARDDEPAAGGDAPTTDVIRWGTCPPWPAGPLVLLRDGGVLAGRIAAADENGVELVSASLGRLVLPTGAVRGYRASQGIGPGAIAPAADHDGRRHLLILANGDRVAARRIAWKADAVTIEPATRRSAATPQATVSIPAAAVRAVEFASSTAAPATPSTGGRPPHIMAAIVDGSRFTIASLEPASPLAGGRRVRLAMRLRDRELSTHCDADEIVAIAVDGGRGAFLAGREPDVFEQAGDFGPAWPLARGHAVTGDWPAVRGVTAFTALGMHARARVRYRLDGPATRFESLVAIDDSAGAGGSVIVRVLAGDGEPPLQEVFSSPVLRGGDAPLRIRVEFSASSVLELVVDPADGGDVLDRTLWLDPVAVLPSEAVDRGPR